MLRRGGQEKRKEQKEMAEKGGEEDQKGRIRRAK